MKTSFLFAAWPYIAAALLATGILIRYLLVRNQVSSITARMSEAWATFGGSRMWRISLALLFLVHLVGFWFPRGILLWNGSTTRLLVLEGLAFAAGLLALAGWASLMWRHLGHSSSQSPISELLDTIFLSLLFLGILSGLLVAGLYRWGSSWGVMTLTPYAVSLLQGRPAPGFVTRMPFLVRLHIFSAFCAIAVLPLTRLAAVFVWALHHGLELIAWPISAASQRAEAWLRKRNPASWLWPEED